MLNASSHFQVTDTPGLLNRKDADRNAMERLTLACLQYLPTSVLFVTDLTGQCGTTPADQWAIRGALKADFSNKPWVDVFSKADLLVDVFGEADAEGEPCVQQVGIQSSLSFCVLSGIRAVGFCAAQKQA